ncbi:MAG: hypothetical protein Q9178_006571 [Gyalolechia marmorata]
MIPNDPVPHIYTYQLSPRFAAFVAEEFIEGDRLSDVWSNFDQPTKKKLAGQVAEIIVEMGEYTFDGIGGLKFTREFGPTVEGMKLSKGSVNVWAYHFFIIFKAFSTKQHILSYYNKEIYYYTHISNNNIHADLFKPTSFAKIFIPQLQISPRFWEGMGVDILEAEDDDGIDEKIMFGVR